MREGCGWGGGGGEEERQGMGRKATPYLYANTNGPILSPPNALSYFFERKSGQTVWELPEGVKIRKSPGAEEVRVNDSKRCLQCNRLLTTPVRSSSSFSLVGG